ncbi:MAG TPA: HAD hydrolase-like protein [Candidatus Saccharimonadales bacterium]|nr:HAD hydrolase-like protein [Candidatus Saccharimonadales bacterium]
MRAVIFDIDHTIFAAEGAVHDGVRDLLAILRRLGMRIGGLSASDHRALVRLNEAGLTPYFDKLLCADQTVEPKQTSGVHHMLALLQVEAHEAVLVSRAHADILLGKDAGLSRTIGVMHGQDGAPLHEAGADHVVPNMAAVLEVIE